MRVHHSDILFIRGIWSVFDQPFNELPPSIVDERENLEVVILDELREERCISLARDAKILS